MTSALTDTVVEVIKVPAQSAACGDPWACALGDLPLMTDEDLEEARGLEFRLR